MHMCVTVQTYRVLSTHSKGAQTHSKHFTSWPHLINSTCQGSDVIIAILKLVTWWAKHETGIPERMRMDEDHQTSCSSGKCKIMYKVRSITVPSIDKGQVMCKLLLAGGQWAWHTWESSWEILRKVEDALVLLSRNSTFRYPLQRDSHSRAP